MKPHNAKLPCKRHAVLRLRTQTQNITVAARMMAERKTFVDLSGFRAAPSVRLSHLPFEGDRTFPAQR
jgi:hypothetical protein